MHQDELGGSITAGLFIGEFVENTPWVHLDIAGTAWQDKSTANGQAWCNWRHGTYSYQTCFFTFS
nr:hypothetical protein [Alkalicoccobacillus plakortidis]